MSCPNRNTACERGFRFARVSENRRALERCAALILRRRSLEILVFPGSRVQSNGSVFDLASSYRPLFTLMAVGVSAQEGRTGVVNADSAFARVLPDFDAEPSASLFEDERVVDDGGRLFADGLVVMTEALPPPASVKLT